MMREGGTEAALLRIIVVAYPCGRHLPHILTISPTCSLIAISLNLANNWLTLIHHLTRWTKRVIIAERIFRVHTDRPIESSVDMGAGVINMIKE